MDLTPILKLMAEKRASDVFFSAGAPVHIKIDGKVAPINAINLSAELIDSAAASLMGPERVPAFRERHEMNFGFGVEGLGRYRVNVFRQRGSTAIVIRYLPEQPPQLDALHLPKICAELALEKRGLILVVGSTGSGKSTTLSAMIDYRNRHGGGHILTLEDPIEFIHPNGRALINQREIGTDTASYTDALVNAMREAPDVLVIGEIRDRETLREALLFTQTGHLCLATLHANNAYHALNRIVSFFPPDTRAPLLMDLSLSLKAVLSQRLVVKADGRRVAAVEVLLNTFQVSELIQRGEFDRVKDAIAQTLGNGAQTFEQALLGLYRAGVISESEALDNADSRTDMAWQIGNGSAPDEVSRPFQLKTDEDVEAENANFSSELLAKLSQRAKR